MLLTSICAMAKGRVIGENGKIPWHVPSELANFKRFTMGKPIIMGRRTYESIGRPLPGRKNIVLSRQAGLELPGATVCPSLESALDLVANEEEAFVIGGEQIFIQALPLVDRQILSHLDLFVFGDAFYPEFDESEWELKGGRTSFTDEIHWHSCEWVRRKT